MFESSKRLFDEYAKTLGIASLPVEPSGFVQLTVGETATVLLYPESEESLLVVTPVAALPHKVDYGVVRWLLGRNFYDSPMAPFRVACDASGSVVVWGRVPVEALSAEGLAQLLNAVVDEGDLIRAELGLDAPASAA